MSAARAALWIALPFALQALVARALVARAPAAYASAFAQPVAVVTDQYAFGALLLASLGAAVALAAVAYARTIASLSGDAPRRPELACAALTGAAALALACAWLAPAIFSSDVYAYAAYGELARLGANAYAHAPLPSTNPLFAAAIWQWGNPPPACVYGPAFVSAAASVVAAFAPLGTIAQLDGLRGLASLALLACVPLAYAAFPGDARARLAAAATIGLNPVAIWSAAEGHNDALALAVVLGGFALLRRAPNAGAAIVALAGAVKAPGLAAAAPLALGARTRWGALAGIAAAAILALPLLHAVTTEVAPSGHYAPQASLQAVFGAIAPLAVAVALGACATFAWCGTAKLRRGESEGWCYLALAAWVLIPNPYPWYALWMLPLAALAPGTRAANVLLLLSVTSFLRYLPDAAGAPGELGAVALGIVSLAPFLALLRLPAAAARSGRRA